MLYDTRLFREGETLLLTSRHVQQITISSAGVGIAHHKHEERFEHACGTAKRKKTLEKKNNSRQGFWRAGQQAQ